MEQMDSSAVHAIADLAKHAGGAKLAHEDCQSRTWARGDGTATLERATHESDLVLASLDDVHDICRSDTWTQTPSVFVSDESTTVALRGSDRRFRARLDLEEADAFRFLRVMDLNDDPLTGEPSHLVRTLRFKLGACGESLEKLIAALRRVTFASTSQRDAVADHGESSMGKRLSAKVDQIDKIPETLVLQVAPFSVNGCDDTQPIRVGVHVDPVEETVTLAPIAGEIDNALRRMQATIVARLRSMFADDDTDADVLVIGGDCSQ